MDIVETYPQYTSQSGSWHENLSGGANHTKVITFDNTFNSVPEVIIGNNAETYVTVTITEVTCGGFSAKITAKSVFTGTVNYNWNATAKI